MVGSSFRVIWRADETETTAPASLPVRRGVSLDSLRNKTNTKSASAGMGASVDASSGALSSGEEDTARMEALDPEVISGKGKNKGKGAIRKQRSSIGGSKEVAVSVIISGKGSAKLLVCQNQIPTSDAAWDCRYSWEFSFVE
jgi:hypothetical protein